MTPFWEKKEKRRHKLFVERIVESGIMTRAELGEYSRLLLERHYTLGIPGPEVVERLSVLEEKWNMAVECAGPEFADLGIWKLEVG